MRECGAHQAHTRLAGVVVEHLGRYISNFCFEANDA